MNRQYETLDEYLDDLDAIKAQVAEETRDMSPEEVKARFADAARKLYEVTGSEYECVAGSARNRLLR